MKTFGTALIAFVIGALAIAAIQETLRAGEASKNKRSLAEARHVWSALERYRSETGQYPPLQNGLAGAEHHLVPKFARHIWRNDVYGRPYIVFIDQSGVVVVSTGRNGFVIRNDGVTPLADGSLSNRR